MAFGPSKDAVFKIDSPAGATLTDITAYVTGVEISVDGNVIDTTTYGDTWHEYIRGQNDAKISIEGIFDPLMGTLLFALGTATATSTWEYHPQGTASGKQKMSGECLLTSYSEPSSLDEAVTFSAEFQNSTAITVTNN